MGRLWMLGDNVNTDVIIPGRYNVTTDRAQLASHCLCEVLPEFAVQVQPGDIVMAGHNFGCGSSREHAPWAIHDYGFRCLIAPSFADIFYNNCFNNSILPITFDKATIRELFSEVEATEGYTLHVDLASQTVVTPAGRVLHFEIDQFRKNALLQGLDNIGWTLSHGDEIAAYEEKRKQEAPWLFSS